MAVDLCGNTVINSFLSSDFGRELSYSRLCNQYLVRKKKVFELDLIRVVHEI
jgi:hypothetical protein